jgi:hypothetical protein
MASAVYPKALQSFLTQNPSIDVDTDTIKVAAVDLTTDYTYSASHQYKSSVTSYSGSTDATLSSVTGTSGTMDAADLSPAWSSLAQSGSKTIGALVVYKDTGTASTSPLIAYIELGSAVTPNGGDVSVQFSGSGILSI